MISRNNNPDANTDTTNKRNNGDIVSMVKNQEKEYERKLSPDGTRKLQDKINMLTKRNCELETQLRRSLEAGHSKDLHDTMDGVDLSKVKELEKIIRTLKQEKEEMQKDKLDLLEKLKLQEKEIKDALAQKKLAMAEYTEVADKLSELRQHKQKLSRQV